MKKPPVRIVAFALVATAVLGGLTWIWWPAGDPVLRGKSLTAWVEQYYDTSVARDHAKENQQRQAEAQAAIKEIGANAVPALLRRVSAHDSELHRSVVAWIKKIPLLKIEPMTAELRRNRADWGFNALGPLGRVAIPDLMALLPHGDPGVRCTAARCLGHIGPDAEAAIPAILPLLAERKQGLPILAAMDALRTLHLNSELVVPAMLEFLNGSRTEWNYSVPAMRVLSQYQGQATSAIPALKVYLDHAEADKRNAAQTALDYIEGPSAETKANESKPSSDR